MERKGTSALGGAVRWGEEEDLGTQNGAVRQGEEGERDEGRYRSYWPVIATGTDDLDLGAGRPSNRGGGVVGAVRVFLLLMQRWTTEVACRTLMFGNDTGVSLDGAVMLSSGEVRNNWLDFLKNVHKQDAALLRIPAFERAVSQVLRNIQVVRRKFQPKVMANIYENHLRRLTTSLSDYQGQRGYPKHWPQSLDHFELVVETEAGPLMVSPTGQFIVPASCPAFLLVAFITSNLDQATERLLHYKSNKHVERSLHARCVAQLGLSALQKDDNITPDLMIAFCERLIAHSDELAPLLSGVRLWVTHYYSVLSDGDMCVPWNWKL
uniref:DUF4461 domain-containing protein n=1 Tax=Timema poppense TaxID=170557 RepID=A0A7R9CT41_TIMPO|nr:unnamed protein product [Timema poppensis]